MDLAQRKTAFSLLFFALNLDNISHHLGVLPNFEMAETCLAANKLNKLAACQPLTDITENHFLKLTNESALMQTAAKLWCNNVVWCSVS